MSDTIIAFDYGAARIGVARASTIAKLPEALEPISANNADAIKELIELHKPQTIVVGLPRNLHGSATQQTKEVLAFAQELEKYGIEIALQDEALTTVMAEERKKENQSVDSVAAAIILEDYIREHLNEISS